MGMGMAPSMRDRDAEGGMDPAPTQEGMLAELAALRDCAAGQKMATLPDFLDEITRCLAALLDGEGHQPA
jgi:hypothetical protein